MFKNFLCTSLYFQLSLVIMSFPKINLLMDKTSVNFIIPLAALSAIFLFIFNNVVVSWPKTANSETK